MSASPRGSDKRLDYEKLQVYQKSKKLHHMIRSMPFDKSDYDRILSRQIHRCSLSVALNIAEGVGRTSKKDRRHFYIVARGSLYETMAAAEIFIESHPPMPDTEKELFDLGREVARILNTMIKGLGDF